ncbi:hypothetical protein GCM10025858_07200 [Alicyclobacillus sacchari]|uniref:YheC/YheD family endospore coat-associated protein n=1 Tax=Alicyclobacillus sacchari TaxID=392010 RepID=UPI001FB9D6B7|nr:YheC/YheD family protein [Alicyclobacillus sacchari]GMA56217.1 hypothetical protein GCM10025858_07200 [Alicyclobacillus sacchari]
MAEEGNKRKLLGIATTSLPSVRGGIRRPAPHYVRIARAAARMGMDVCLFDPHHVNWQTGSVSGYMPERPQVPEGNWVKRTMRLPDVIYENVYVHLAIRGYSATLREQAKRHQIPLFNPMLPGKWKMISVLRQAGMSDATPETERIASSEQVIHRVNEWQTAYVKPIGGYGGMNVYRIERLHADRYRVSADRRGSHGGKWRKVMSDAQLRTWLRPRVGGYLLQRGLQLLTVGGRKVDFRVVLHRDEHGEWQLVGMVPKVAAPDGVVTNIIAGGERVPMSRLVQMAEADGKTIPLEALETRARAIARALSRRYPTTALVGFDMAVEEDGSVKMIEMNPKPARSLLDGPMLAKLADYQAGFAKFLAK